jgi:PAS domain-containing protein
MDEAIRFEFSLEVIPLPAFVVSPDDHLIDANDAFAMLADRQLETLRGRELASVMTIQHADSALMLIPFRPVQRVASLVRHWQGGRR